MAVALSTLHCCSWGGFISSFEEEAFLTALHSQGLWKTCSLFSPVLTPAPQLSRHHPTVMALPQQGTGSCWKQNSKATLIPHPASPARAAHPHTLCTVEVVVDPIGPMLHSWICTAQLEPAHTRPRDGAGSDHQPLCFTQNQANLSSSSSLFRLQSHCLGAGDRAICLLFPQQNILQ